MKTLTNKDFISNGGSGYVYRISEDKVVKTLRIGNGRVSPEFKAEFRMQYNMYNDGIPVPRPHGFDEFIFPSSDLFWDIGSGIPTKRRGIVMDYIEGTNMEEYIRSLGDDLSKRDYFSEKSRVLGLLKREISIATDLGFLPGIDATERNAILTPEGNVVIIDVAKWFISS